jgi:putative tryptophan/tyrosine transport system substrate-binding protein
LNQSRLLLWRIVSVWVISGITGGLLSSFVFNEDRDSGIGHVPKIAILQAEPQPWADALTMGFINGLEEEALVQGHDVVLLFRSAKGSDLDTLARSVAEDKGLALVYTLGTQASQAYFAAMHDGRTGTSAPMVFGAVTNPIDAGFYGTREKVARKNLTGSQDLWPYEQQFDLMRTLLRTADKVGMAFDESEANTVASLPSIRAAATAYGFALVERKVIIGRNEAAADKTQKVEGAIEELIADGVQAIYIGPDNLTQGQAAAIIAISKRHRVPVFTGVSEIVDKGAVATVGINYLEVGRLNGRQAAQILRGAIPRNLRPEIAKKGDRHLNLAALDDLHIEVPQELKKDAT